MKYRALILALCFLAFSVCARAQSASMVQIGPLANRPAVGSLWFVTDDGQQRLTFWNGTTWIDVAPGLTSSGLLSVSSHPAMTGDVTTGAGSVATTIGSTKVTNSMLAGSIDLATKVTGILPSADFPALTGDVTTISGAVGTTIANNAVTNAKAAQMATKTYKGRTSAGTGNSEDVAVATLKTDLVLVKADVGLGNVDNVSDANKPISTAEQTALNLKADLASPTFSGTPSLPTGTTGTTQAAADNTTKLATTAFVTTADNLKANLAGPTFTGTPAAPTAAVDTNTTQVATTAFVVGQGYAKLASPTLTGTPAIAAATGTSLTVTGAVTSSGTAGVGYTVGAGGAITQITSKSTAVTLNKITGAVTMNAAALAANTSVSFTVTNSTVAATDVPQVAIKSGATAGSYFVTIGAVAAGSFVVHVRNISAGSLSEAIVINFVVLKGAAS